VQFSIGLKIVWHGSDWRYSVSAFVAVFCGTVIVNTGVVDTKLPKFICIT